MTNDPNQLSEREREILRLVATGLSNQQIAAQLGISPNTVKVHLRNVFSKAGVASRTEATMYAIRNGIVAVDRAADDPAVAVADAPEPPSEAVASPAVEPLALTPVSSTELALEAAAPDAPVAEPEPAPAVTLPPATVEVIRPSAPPRPHSRRWIATTLAFALVALVAVGALVYNWTQAGARDQPAPSQPTAAGAGQSRWKQLKALSAPRAAFAATTVADQIYVIGGSGAQGVLDLVERFDPQSQTWATLSAKPTPVMDVQAVVLGERIYVPGGRTADDPRSVSDVFERYDPRTERWETLPKLPAPRSAYGLAAIEGKIYLFGGWDGTSVRNEVYEYDPGTNAWTARTPMDTERAYLATTVVGANVYLTGGENSTGPLALNDVYTPSREGDKPWARLAPLPAPRSRSGAAAIPNFASLYVMGGGANDPPLIYRLRSNNWETLDASPQPIGNGPAVVEQGGMIVTLGGEPEPQRYTGSVQGYQAIYNVLP